MQLDLRESFARVGSSLSLSDTLYGGLSTSVAESARGVGGNMVVSGFEYVGGEMM